MSFIKTKSSLDLIILYGSQTGCAQESAERIAREARRRHFCPIVCSMDAFPKAKLPEQKCVIFVCSVTGQGDEPDNMKKFWRFLLRKDLPSDSLQGLDFAVFGQGDSSYAKFNYPAKKLYRRLLQLGANSLIERGDGDDQHPLGVDGALDPWLQSLWKVLLQKYPLPAGQEIIPSTVILPNTYRITFLDENGDEYTQSKTASHVMKHLPMRTSVAPFKGIVRKNERMTPETHFQDVRHIEIEIDESCSYTPGDVFHVHPKNSESMVQEVIDFLGWSHLQEKRLVISVNKEAYPDLTLPERFFPVDHHVDMNANDTNTHNTSGYITLKDLMIHYLDLFGKPRRYFFELLSFFAMDPVQKEKLSEFAFVPESQQDLYDYAYKPKRTCFEVLQDFHSVKVPLQYLLDLFPMMRERAFSIASCGSSEDPKKVRNLELTVAIVKYKTRMAAPRRGICTQWMETWTPGDVIHFSISKGTFRLPPRLDIPVVCIGLGTGIAPLRSLIHARHYQAQSCNSLSLPSSSSSSSMKTMLLFGCRSQNADFYYRKEWETLERHGTLDTSCGTNDTRHTFHLVTAFSRDQPHKIYIQNRMDEDEGLQQRLFDWIVRQGGYIYVCGNSNQIPQEIRNAIITVFQRQSAGDTRMSLESANAYLENMIRTGRYQEESWS